MYESDQAWRERREANFAEQDARIERENERRAQNEKAWQPPADDSSPAPNYGPRDLTGNLSGYGLGILIFWPFIYWRYTLFAALMTLVNMGACYGGSYLIFSHHWPASILPAALGIGYLFSVWVAALGHSWLKLRVSSVGVLILLGAPWLFIFQLGLFYNLADDVSHRLKAHPEWLTNPNPRNPNANQYIDWNMVHSVFTPEVFMLGSPEQTLREAWNHELTLPEGHGVLHRDPQFQLNWLDAYIQKNVPQRGLVDPLDKRANPDVPYRPDPVLKVRGQVVDFGARIPTELWNATGWTRLRQEFEATGYNSFKDTYKGLVIYFLPTLIGFWIFVKSRWKIFLLNGFLGWTGIGWLVAVYWLFGPRGK